MPDKKPKLKTKSKSKLKKAPAKKAVPKSEPKAATAKKETIYVDIDDEVTAVIDKIINAEGTIAAVVLPKKATVFLSQVNIKLIKRAANKADKKLVLITSDKAIMAIASNSGVPTAATLTSKPHFPEDNVKTADEEVTVDLQDAAVAAAVVTTAAGAKKVSDDATVDDAIELDNTSPAASIDEDVETEVDKKKLKIPDFSSFRLKLILGLALIIGLGVAWFYGFVILPEAKVFVNADISTVAVDERVTLDVDAGAVDTEKNIIPAERVQVEKINTATVPATGEKNIGEKATGVLNLENCIDSGETEVLAAGTRFSAGSLTFVTTEQVIFQPAVTDGTNCFSKALGRDKNVDVEALEPGPAFNIGEQEFASSVSGINAFGGPMTGGTTEVITVVSQEDVDKAAAQIEGGSRAEALDELQQQLRDLGADPLTETLAEGKPETVFTPGIDAEASEVKVTTTITYNLLGIRTDDVQAIVDASIEESLAGEQKNIRDNGLADVAFTVVDASDNAAQIMQLRTVASVGPDIDTEALKVQIAGLKRGEIETLIESIDGVRSVSVEYSPGWVTTTPKNAEKITIELNETDDQ